jgi:DNA helicase-2/ATP-dependent DNA helicase PcrA
MKGIRVLATGDFTHPQWAAEIEEMLEESEHGLLRLKDEYLPDIAPLPGGFGPGDVRFILNVEISSIYKKHGATRKVHNLIFMPDKDSMRNLNARLDRIGNIRSDGRPILGLDSRNLLEIALEVTPECFVIPAHVWTPWFSLLGSKSGFDSVEECFEDLTQYIFALETGLSSDPEMNRRVSSLDSYTLISNSDTHSPSRLGREVNIFEGIPGYRAIRDAIKAAAPNRSGKEPGAGSDEARFMGTIEFFPEEGKYHLDGHRKCSVRLEPSQTVASGGRCPVCGHVVTVGVVNRVHELSDRESGDRPGFAPFWRMLSLPEIIAQTLGVGRQSKKVDAIYREILSKLGPELDLLWSLEIDTVAKTSPLIAEALKKVRGGNVIIQPGYDGEYGTVELFTPGERENLLGQESLLPGHMPISASRTTSKPVARKPRQKTVPKNGCSASAATQSELNEQQERAASVFDRPVLVQAGPGTGKTRTLIARIAQAIQNGIADPQHTVAVTFTRKAAQEVRDRLARTLPAEQAEQCWAGTFHQLGIRVLKYFSDQGMCKAPDSILTWDLALEAFVESIKESGMKVSGTHRSMFETISSCKQNLVHWDNCENPELARAYSIYQQHLEKGGLLDLDDLLMKPADLLRSHPDRAEAFSRMCARHLCIDEFQDANLAQYSMVRLLAESDGAGLFAIGDPDQAIYGFRGADRRFFLTFEQDYPSVCKIHLGTNYRSKGPILKFSQHILDHTGLSENLTAYRQGKTKPKIVHVPTETYEAEYISRTIDAIIGGTSFFSKDSGRAEEGSGNYGFRDFAVLFRLNSVGDALEEKFKSSGIPFQRARKSSPMEEAEAYDPRAEAVALMTVHAAKGLEFPVVFIAGCEDGIIPHIVGNGEGPDSADWDEERRVLYVGMTRAADMLYVTHSTRRTFRGKVRELPCSRFLSETPKNLCEFHKPSSRARAPRQCGLFD